jgi:hypothetical protein
MRDPLAWKAAYRAAEDRHRQLLADDPGHVEARCRREHRLAIELLVVAYGAELCEPEHDDDIDEFVAGLVRQP